jgi:hypothetical protein
MALNPAVSVKTLLRSVPAGTLADRLIPVSEQPYIPEWVVVVEDDLHWSVDPRCCLPWFPRVFGKRQDWPSGTGLTSARIIKGLAKRQPDFG